MVFCNHCGITNDHEARFCANCGKAIRLNIELENLGPDTGQGRDARFQAHSAPRCTQCGRTLDNPGSHCLACKQQAYYSQYRKPGRTLRPLLLITLIMLILGGFGYLYFFSDYFQNDSHIIGALLPAADQRVTGEFSEENVQEIFNTTDSIQSLINEQYETGWQGRDSIFQLADKISGFPGVEYTEPDSDHLLVKYVHGGEQLWLFDPPVGEALPVDAASIPKAYDSTIFAGTDLTPSVALLSTASMDYLAAPFSGGRAVILNGLHDDPSYDYLKRDLDMLADLLNELGYRVDRYNGSEANIERYKTLDSYDFIFVAGHGGAGRGRNGDWYKIQTGERAPMVSGTIEGITKYWSDWTNGYIAMQFINWDPSRQLSDYQRILARQRYWAVTNRFFEEYSNSFEDSIFVSWSCSGLKNDSIASALVNAGNSVYIGWTDEFGKSPLPVYCLMRQLAAGNSLAQAFDLIPDDWKNDYNHGNAELTYYPQSAGSYTFNETASDALLGRLEPYCTQDRGKTYLWICDTAGNLGKYHGGDVEVIGRMGVVMTDIAFNAAGNLYGISFYDLYRIDPQTAEIELIGKHGIPGGNALVFGPDGTLYGAGSNSKLYAIDPRSGQGRELAETGFASSGDLTFHNGDLYLTGRGSTSDVLVRIDPQTYRASAVGNIGFHSVYGLDSFPDGLLYGITGTDLIRIFPETGEGRVVDSYDGHGLRGANGSTVFGAATGEIDSPPEDDSRNGSYPLPGNLTEGQVSNTIDWANNYEGTTWGPGEGYYNACLQFVQHAYLYGGKITIKTGYGTAANAANILEARNNESQEPPPPGSWVFYSVSNNAAGHAALSLGEGQVIHVNTDDREGQKIARVEKRNYRDEELARAGIVYIGWAWPEVLN